MVLHDREQCLIAVSGDGTLTVNDLRTGKVCSPPSGIYSKGYCRCADVFIMVLCHLACSQSCHADFNQGQCSEAMSSSHSEGACVLPIADDKLQQAIAHTHSVDLLPV